MAKRSQLVCQHLENISSDALEKYQDVIRNYVRGRQGIYALYRRNKIYYVGLASNLRNRLKHHLRDRHKGIWDRFSVYLTIGDSHLRELESLILRTVKPRGNTQTGKFFKSENLRSRLARDLRAKHREELNWLIGRATVPTAKRLHHKNGREKGKPVMASYVNRSIRLRATYRGKLVRASIRRNGLIRYKTKDFHSPSLAAAAIVKRSANGWTFWKYERAPGDWVLLDDLRR
jgi:hypothetical protein